MRRYDEFKIRCPYIPSEQMPYLSFQKHQLKCKMKFLAEYPSRRVFHCKYNYMHIFFDEALLREHEENDGQLCHMSDMTQTLVRVPEDEFMKKMPKSSNLYSKEKKLKGNSH